ncbi:MAG: tetratricopeptide repeat-containing diguanylate cyclase [Sarcina sp.]
MKIFNRFILLFSIITFVFILSDKTVVLAQTMDGKSSVNTLIQQLNNTDLNLDINKKIELNIEIGNYYNKEGQIDDAIKYLGNAVNQSMEQGNLDKANSTMFSILAIGIENKRYTIVMQYSLSLLDNLSELYRQTGKSIYIKNMIGVDYLVATTCNILGDKAYGESYFNVGNELENEYHVQETASMDYVKSNYYYYQNNFVEAKKFAQSGILISKKEKNELGYLNGLIYLARTQISQNNLNDAATSLKIVFANMKKVKSTLLESQYYYYSGLLNEALDNKNEAIENYLKSYQYTKNEVLYDTNGNILFRLGKLYSGMGEYQKATEYYQKYIVQEQKLSESKGKVNANIIFNMHENDPQNILNEIKIKKSQSDNRILLLLFIGVVILAAIIGGEYYKKRKKMKKLNSELNKDILTKAYNRRYTMSYIQKLDRQRIDFALVMLDVDNYKMVNDTYGHMFGDKVLKRLVETIKLVAGERVLVCRYGGEEFLLVIDIEDIEIATRITKRIVRAIESVEWEYGNTITASCGLVKHKNGDKLHKTLECADKLLYVAKRNGKNRVEY